MATALVTLETPSPLGFSISVNEESIKIHFLGQE